MQETFSEGYHESCIGVWLSTHTHPSTVTVRATATVTVTVTVTAKLLLRHRTVPGAIIMMIIIIGLPVVGRSHCRCVHAQLKFPEPDGK